MIHEKGQWRIEVLLTKELSHVTKVDKPNTIKLIHIVRIQLDGMKEPTTQRSEENDDQGGSNDMKRRSGELKCYLIGHLNHLTKVDKLNTIKLIQPIVISHSCTKAFLIYAIYIQVRPIHLKNSPNPHRISTYILKKERKLNQPETKRKGLEIPNQKSTLSESIKP